jgi:HTH-type transcriptional regulator/antitoxin HigA
VVQGLPAGEEEMSTLTEYRSLLTKYAPQPIRCDEDYQHALIQLEELMVPHPDGARSLLIEVLATLVEKYESRENPTPRLAPPEMLAHLLKSKGGKPADVAKATGISPATLSSVLAHRRGISKANALKLGEYFLVSPLVFLMKPALKQRSRRSS